jgi:hypothetical protein
MQRGRMSCDERYERRKARFRTSRLLALGLTCGVWCAGPALAEIETTGELSYDGFTDP